MKEARFRQLVESYPRLRVGVVGDLCLDRYWEIDPELEETSLETGLPVWNVSRVRCSPGGCGTVCNNLAALGAGRIDVVSFWGIDGEGFELNRLMQSLPTVSLDGVLRTEQRRTFTYNKPLFLRPNAPAQEQSRLDMKNRSATPTSVSQQLADRIHSLSREWDVAIVLDQVSEVGTGVVTPEVLDECRQLATRIPVIADSRTGLSRFPKMIYKMNQRELELLSACDTSAMTQQELAGRMSRLAEQLEHAVFVTLAEQGMLGAMRDRQGGWTVEHQPAVPVRPPIDIVGAGDAVTANLALALVAGAELGEAMQLAMWAASCVVKQLGTTGTATVDQLWQQALAGKP